MGSLELTEESTLLGFIIQTAQNDRAGRWNFLHIPRVCILNRQGWIVHAARLISPVARLPRAPH